MLINCYSKDFLTAKDNFPHHSETKKIKNNDNPQLNYSPAVNSSNLYDSVPRRSSRIPKPNYKYLASLEDKDEKNSATIHEKLPPKP